MDIGGYRTERQLGAGAGGVVWQAVAPDGSTVALKVIDAPYAAALGAAKREAGLTAQVDHPHLLRVAAVVCDADRVAVAMPLAAGGSLADLLARRGRLRPAELLTVLIPIASALATAHERGVVHGDLSPANIVFDGDGRPLLTDLGAARVALECGIEVAAAPGYVAPEVAKGAVPDSAADVFALGAVALHCLSGRAAWNADDLRDVVVQSTVGQWPDPDDADGPPALLAAIRSSLLDVPGKRPGAASLVIELSRMGPAEPVELGADSTTEPPVRSIGDDGSRSETGAAADADADADADAGADVGADSGDGSVARARIRQVATRLRADAVRPVPTGQQHTGHRLGAAGRRIDRRATVRIAGVVLGLALIGALAVQAGLIWAGTGQQAGSSAPSIAAAASDDVASDDVASDDGAASSARSEPGAGTSAAGSSRTGTSTAGSSGAGTSAAGSSAAIPRQSSSVSSSESVPSGSAPAAGSQRATDATAWLTVARELDKDRARALVGRDADLLDAVYTASSPARKADAATISRLAAQDLRVDGAAHRIVAVAVLAVGKPVRIEVTDELPSYHLLDPAGTAVGITDPRPRGHRVLELVDTADGYRIAAVADH